MVAFEDVTRHKPEPDTFLEAARRTFDITSTTAPELAKGAVHRLRRRR